MGIDYPASLDYFRGLNPAAPAHCGDCRHSMPRKLVATTIATAAAAATATWNKTPIGDDDLLLPPRLGPGLCPGWVVAGRWGGATFHLILRLPLVLLHPSFNHHKRSSEY